MADVTDGPWTTPDSSSALSYYYAGPAPRNHPALARQQQSHHRSLRLNSYVLIADVPDPVSIIGFPFGETAAGQIAIWVRGSIATDMETDYGGLPCFLVDARTRQGQSGSPVIVYKGESGTGRMSDGSITSGSGIMSNLLGVYSGRINAGSDLGQVWKTAAVIEILENGVLGNRDLTPGP